MSSVALCFLPTACLLGPKAGSGIEQVRKHGSLICGKGKFDRKGKITRLFPRVPRREIKGEQYHFQEKKKEKREIFLDSEVVLEDEDLCWEKRQPLVPH